MKYLLILLFSISCLGQNTTQWYLFGSADNKINTYIGGIGLVTNTKALLATKLGISPYSIRNFSIDKGNIKCSIINKYSVPESAFDGNANITYFIDLGKVVDVSAYAFRGCEKLKYVELKESLIITGDYSFRNETSTQHSLRVVLPKVSNIDNVVFYTHNRYTLKLYAPLTTSVGVNALDNQVLYRTTAATGLRMYANTFLLTSNSGAEEGDVAYFRNSRAAAITYVTDFTVPNNISDFTIGTVTANTIQVNFTPPTGSINNIEYYEVWLDGAYYQDLSASGQDITGLSSVSSYEIEIKPVDIYYNKSSSNKITQLTL